MTGTMQGLLEQTQRWRPCLEGTRQSPCYRPGPRRRHSCLEVRGAALKEVPSWTHISATAGASALEGYTIMKNAVPRSAPTPTLPADPDETSDKPVLL